MEELEILIDPEGNVVVHVRGPAGTTCLETTKNLESAIGDVRERSYTGEFYEQESAGCVVDRISTRGR